MINHQITRFLLAFILLSPSTAFADEADKPPPYRMTFIKSVTLDPADNETPEVCSTFNLSYRHIREFFYRASRISEKKYEHDLYKSRCYLTGKIVFANRDRGEWEIDRARRGVIRLTDGRNLYFYCPNCNPAVFDKVLD